MTKKKHRFKKTETGYHSSAVKILAGWVNGIIEPEFCIDNKIAFVPDVYCPDEKRIYEVVHSHPVTGKKLGLIQYWCFRNSTEMTVFEVDSDFILKQTEKPDIIEVINTYIVEYCPIV